MTEWENSRTFIPSPEHIRRECERIRNGDVVLSGSSEKRWRELRELQAATDRWELGGTIEDDRCEMPDWFGG